MQAYLSSIQIASMHAMREGILAYGPANTTIVAFETMMDSRTLFLTPNTSSVYMMSWLDLTDGPMVIETPPNVLGIIDDHWFHYVTDFGNAGPDRGQGGRFLLLPLGYDGEVPDGYHAARTQTFGNWVVWRGFQVDGDPAPAVQTTRERFHIYPLGGDPVEMTMVNVSGSEMNTIHRMDAAIFDEVDETVQAEPPDGQDPEILGLLASIGIRRGTTFAPDERMRRILAEAADVGAATARALAARPTVHRSTGPAPTSSTSPRTCPPRTSGPSSSTTTRPGRCSRPISSSPPSAARAGPSRTRTGPSTCTSARSHRQTGRRTGSRPSPAWVEQVVRLYGPLETWFDETWRPGDPTLVG